MNITESTLIPGLAFVMAAGTFAASAQKAVPALPDDNGKTGTTAALTDTRGGSWTSLGIGRYRDNIMHVFRLINDWYPEWDVEIMQSETNPGLYRWSTHTAIALTAVGARPTATRNGAS